jgi:hypothetical protein
MIKRSWERALGRSGRKEEDLKTKKKQKTPWF